MTTTMHYQRGGRDLDYTQCGMLNRPSGQVTTRKERVTCRRCLKSFPDVKVVNAPFDASGFTEVMNAFTAILQQATKVMSLQERMTAVARKLANANEAHRELTLSASEVETLGILLFLLQKKS